MSLETAMEKLADAYNRYSEVAEKQIELQTKMLEKGVVLLAPADAPQVAAATATTKAETKPAEEKQGRGKGKAKEDPKPAAKEEKEEADDFADDGDDFADDDDKGGEKALTADQIKDLLMKVKKEASTDAARGILAKLGVNTIAQIPADKYAEVVKLAKKEGVSL